MINIITFIDVELISSHVAKVNSKQNHVDDNFSHIQCTSKPVDNILTKLFASSKDNKYSYFISEHLGRSSDPIMCSFDL